MPVEVAADPIEISPDKVIPIALIVNELLTNAFKYAGGEATHEACGSRRCAIPPGCWSSASPTTAPACRPISSSGPGWASSSCRRLLLQLHGTMETASSPEGTTVTVTVPLGGGVA